MRRSSPVAVLVAVGLLGSSLVGCSNSARTVAFVGAWEDDKGTLVVQRNGLAEGRLFGAKTSRAFTWRADGQAIRLTFGRIASDAVEYRGTIDEAGRLVVESETQNCVLKRTSAPSP